MAIIKNLWSSWCDSVVNKSDQEPLGCGFNPWPCSVGWGSGVAMSCGVCCRCSLDPTLLWLWCRPAAIAPMRHLAWEPLYATGAALKRQNKQTNKKHSLQTKVQDHMTSQANFTKHTKKNLYPSFLNFSKRLRNHFLYIFQANVWAPFSFNPTKGQNI